MKYLLNLFFIFMLTACMQAESVVLSVSEGDDVSKLYSGLASQPFTQAETCLSPIEEDLLYASYERLDIWNGLM